MPRSETSLNEARRYAAEQEQIAAATSHRVRTLWLSIANGERNVPDAAASFATVAPSLLEAGQDSAVRSSDVYLSRYLSLELGRRVAPVGLEPSQFRGVNGTNIGAGAAYSAAVVRAAAYSRGVGFSIDEAIANGAAAAARLTRTEVRVAGRASVSLLIDGREIRGRPRVRGYTRMTTGATPCLACLSAAGATFESGEAFAYHPGCGCAAVPNVDGVEQRVQPPSGRELFDRLSHDDQDRAFGQSAAQMIRDGASLSDFAAHDGRYLNNRHDHGGNRMTDTPPQPNENDVERTPGDDGRYDAEVVERLRTEAAERRVRARDAEQAREAAEKRADALSARLLGVALKEHAPDLADPADLLTYAEAATLLDDDGEPDAEKIKAAAADLLVNKPHLAARRAPEGDIDQGARGTVPPEPYDFAAALRKAAG